MERVFFEASASACGSELAKLERILIMAKYRSRFGGNSIGTDARPSSPVGGASILRIETTTEKAVQA